MKADTRGPAAIILDAGTQAVQAAEQITDPIARCHALEEATENLRAVQQQLRQGRAAAIRAARKDRSATDVAAELGISRVRLYKILEGTD